jgi:hypothetical protein
MKRALITVWTLASVTLASVTLAADTPVAEPVYQMPKKAALKWHLANLIAASTVRAAPDQRVQPLEKGCAIYAYDFECRAARILGIHDIWVRLIAFKWIDGKETRGHALCVFALKNGDLWGYDHTKGSFSLNTQDKSEEGIQKAIAKWLPTVYDLHFIDLSNN